MGRVSFRRLGAEHQMLLWDKHWQIPEELLVAGPTSCRSFWYVKQAFVLYINSELYSTFVISCQETVILFADGKENPVICQWFLYFYSLLNLSKYFALPVSEVTLRCTNPGGHCCNFLDPVWSVISEESEERYLKWCLSFLVCRRYPGICLLAVGGRLTFSKILLEFVRLGQ